jgi:ring-1,2-phenylacetyl-CoA epoxidase subunit PaaE
MSLDKTKLCKELVVSKTITETTDAVSLVFSIPKEFTTNFQYKPGQFVTLFLDINGQEVRRSFSLASSPDMDSEFKITVKRVPNGLASTHLTQKVKAGDKLWVTPPAGLFTLPADFNAKKVVLYAAGSGITPVYSILKSVLKKYPEATCLLVYQNKNSENTIYRREIQDLQSQFATKFQVENIYSDASADWPGLRGRLSSDQIRDLLVKHGAGIQSHHFMCGPDAFMSTIRETLAQLNVPKDKIHFESFAGVTPKSTATANTSQPTPSGSNFQLDPDAIVIGDKNEISAPEEIEVLLDGETRTVPHLKNSTILESLLEAGMNPPYSCMDGACLACMAKVEKGAVYQNDPGILSDDNIEAKECLTCQARPASKKVRINFSVF